MPSVPKFWQFFTYDDPLYVFYDCLDNIIFHLQSYPGKKRKIMSVEDSSPVGDDHFFDSVSSSSELDLLVDCFPLGGLFIGIDLEPLTNHTH